MHKLDRNVISAPDCLGLWDYTTHTWNDFTRDGVSCKREVRLALQRMQGQQVLTTNPDDEAYFILGLRCAYCESQIFYGGHVEHFRRKHDSHYPEFTFVWGNLFLACSSNEHCGHYKDRPLSDAYDPDDLVKPDEHLPDDFLYFHSSGEVRARDREGMTLEDQRRGAETIRVFNLDCPSLQGSRRKSLKRYIDRSVGIIDAIMDFDHNDRQVFIAEEIEATKWDPYSTTIRHFFEKLA